MVNLKGLMKNARTLKRFVIMYVDVALLLSIII